ncbi:hypothetical protein AKO1_009073 [Acrasis kona]|uniref:RRM domain-containing protein n=1 Tax=Acrasis kona TaxID=1008807 RepID=A0AAW2ZGU0_9EUKA
MLLGWPIRNKRTSLNMNEIELRHKIAVKKDKIDKDTRTVFITGVPKNSTRDELMSFFSEQGAIQQLSYHTDTNFVKILFESKQSAEHIRDKKIEYTPGSLLTIRTKTERREQKKQIERPSNSTQPIKRIVYQEEFIFPDSNDQCVYKVDELEKRLDHRFYTDPKRLTTVGMKTKQSNKEFEEERSYYKSEAFRDNVFGHPEPTMYAELPPDFLITCTHSQQVINEWISENIFNKNCTAVGIDTEGDFIRYNHVDIIGEVKKKLVPELITISNKRSFSPDPNQLLPN